MRSCPWCPSFGNCHKLSTHSKACLGSMGGGSSNAGKDRYGRNWTWVQ